ncbi:MAG TPA: hypothetical protein VJ399_02815 [Patescibacteria group bacterium]|nr:hypothetical protein [Patescibacteria group bacterium]
MERINEGHLGWKPTGSTFSPVRIIESSSKCDATIFEHKGLIEARLGVLNDAEIVSIDPTKDKVLKIWPSNGNGFQQVTVEFQGKHGNSIENVFIPIA